MEKRNIRSVNKSTSHILFKGNLSIPKLNMDKLILKNLLFGSLYISFSVPMSFFIVGLPMILQMEGFSQASIGLFQLAGIPHILMFLLSPVVDGVAFKKNHYKKWILSSGMLYCILLIGISFFSLKDNYYLIFSLILCAVFLSSFSSIPLNALSIKVFNEGERAAAGGYKSGAFFISAILGNGVMLLVYNHFGWRCTLLIMSLLVLLSIVSLFFIYEKSETLEAGMLPYHAILSFFKQRNICSWIFVLTIYFAFISPVWMFMKPYLISKGISPDMVAVTVGIHGGIVGSAGSVSISLFSKYHTKKRMLLIFAVFNMFSISVLILTELYQADFPYVVIAVTLIAFSMALSSSIIFALMMDYARKKFRGVDYSLQSNLGGLGGIVSAVIAGRVIQEFGYKNMFVFDLAGMCCVVMVIYAFFHGNEPSPGSHDHVKG